MINQYQSVLDDICDKLEDKVGLGIEASDLHHYLCNQDYFIIGTDKAKKFLNDDAFEAIELIKNYEQFNFGEVSTDLSDPEKVVNMFAYIVGEHILAESDHLEFCVVYRQAITNGDPNLVRKHGNKLDEDDLKTINSEICAMNATKLYHETTYAWAA